jgi:iron complex outermembrane receptor protein
LANFLAIFSAGQLANERARGLGFWDVDTAIPNPVSSIEQWQTINTTTWHASDTLTVKNIASYAQFTDLQRTELFATNWQVSNLPPAVGGAFFAGIPGIFTGVFPAPGANTADQATYTEELQFQGSALDQKLTYQGGVYLEWSDPLGLVGNQSSQLASCSDPAVLATCSDPLGTAFTVFANLQRAAFGLGPSNTYVGAVNSTVGETTYRDRGVYTQETYAITDQFKITGGARYTWDKQQNEAVRTTYQFPVSAGDTLHATCTDPATAPTCQLRQEQSSSKPTWLIDFDYKPTDDNLIYAKYARGYRAGGVFTNAPVDHRVFAPEKVDNYEVGYKTAFHDPVRTVFNVAAFYNNFSNQQIQFGFNPSVDPNTHLTAPVSPTTAIINAGKSRIYGAEVEVSVNPFQGLTFDFNYTYLNATIRSITPVSTTDPNYVAAAGNIAPGSPLALSPKNKYTLSGRYSLPLDKTLGDIFVGAFFSHTDKQLTNYNYFNPAVETALGGDFGSVGARNLVDLSGGWNDIFGSTIDVTAFATNVTNQKYYNFIPGLGAVQSQLEFATVGEPRMYGIRVKYRFGN